MIYRKATQDDIIKLCEIRKIQLQHEGIEPSLDIDQDLLRFFTNAFENQTIIEYLAVEKTEIIATGAVCFYDYPPTYTNQTGRIAYITNMYTNPKYRKQGIATHMLDLLMSEIRHRKIEIVRLGASALGRSVYERYGFVQDHQWLHFSLLKE